jgi:hypothetical protein
MAYSVAMTMIPGRQTVDESPLTTTPTDDAPPNVSVPDASDEAPYGWMTDRKTGQQRPRKRPPFSSKTFREQRHAQAADEPGDRAPGRTRRGRRRGPETDKRPKSEPEYPAFRAGPIAKGMNRLYFRAGKLVRMFDPTVGEAFMQSATKLDDEDVTVGEAWEEIARTNPRLRAVLMRMIEGNAWAALFMAHAPIMLAVAMKPAIRDRLPFGRLLEAFLDDGPAGEPSGIGEMLGGMTASDAAQMLGVAQGMMAQFTAGSGRQPAGVPRPPAHGDVFGMGRPMVDLVQGPDVAALADAVLGLQGGGQTT